MKDRKKTKKSILLVILIVFIVIILAGLGYIFFVLYNNRAASEDYSKVRESAAADTSQSESSTQNLDLADNPIDFNALAEINDDIYAWISIPGTEVDYPVLQSKESDYFYLDHDVYKNYLYAGSIYTEVCNSKKFSDRNTVLYGHNMADGSMFATLHRFEDSEFFNENKYIYIYMPGRKLTYEVVSAYNYDNRHIMNSFNFSDDKVFQEYIESVMNPRSLVCNTNGNIKLDLNSKLITLSTCLDSDDSGRYLVQGVLIKDEQTN